MDNRELEILWKVEEKGLFMLNEVGFAQARSMGPQRARTSLGFFLSTAILPLAMSMEISLCC